MKPSATIITDSTSFLSRFQIWRLEVCSIFQQGKIPWKADIAAGREGGEVEGISFNQIQLSVRKKAFLENIQSILFRAYSQTMHTC